MLVYAHPVTAAMIVALVGYVGSLGLRARNDRRQARRLLARHARLARILYGMVVAVWVSGVLSTWMLRRDLAAAESGHFRVGSVLVMMLSVSALSSRWMTRRPMRALHPWFGAAAILLAAAQLFFGLQILP